MQPITGYRRMMRVPIAIVSLAALMLPLPTAAQEGSRWPIPPAAHAAMAAGDPAKARSLSEAELANCLAASDGEWPCLDLLTVLGNFTLAAGDIVPAFRYALRAVTLAKEELPADHLDIAVAMNNLARVLDVAGEYQKAEPFHRQALAIYLENPDEAGAKLIVISYGNLGLNLRAQGRQAEAMKVFRTALDLGFEFLDAGDPTLPRLITNFAGLLNEMGSFGDAETLYRKALEYRLAILPADHPDIGRSYNNLATTLDRQGRHIEAEDLHRRAIAILEAASGTDADLAGAYGNLASNLSEQGQIADATPLYRRALELHLASLPSDHPDIALSYANLAANLSDRGLAAEAEPYYREALAIARMALPANHPDLATHLTNLATNLGERGMRAAAQALNREALAIREASLAPSHPAIGDSHSNLAVGLAELGEVAEAENHFRAARRIWAQSLAAGHPRRIRGDALLAMFLQDRRSSAAEVRSLLRAAQVGVAVRLAAYDSFDSDARSELGRYRTVFVRQVRNGWDLAQP